MMRKLSVVIITYNEEKNIGRCIGSVAGLADEVVVLDSFSTDETVSIARAMGAKVFQEKFKGYIGQKNAAMWLATHDYVLSLDADESLDDKLRISIEKIKEDFQGRAYSMNRCTCYCGHFIRHGLWYPDKKIRLFDRRIATWGGLNPHDKIQLQEGIRVEHLEGDILHYSFNTPEDLAWQNNRLSSIAAASLYTAGKRTSLVQVIIRPSWAFLNGYLLRTGFLDGLDGFTIAIHTAHQVFMKHSKLLRLQRSKHSKNVTPLKQEGQQAKTGIN
jgi:GTP:adenosylcobinamide-phosphate guanylyltransferase